jgi:hypothetical protein
MATTKKYLYNDEEIARITDELKKIEADVTFHTNSSYSANTGSYPDNLIPFVQKHMLYLTEHPFVNPDQYLSNLRLMIKVR